MQKIFKHKKTGSYYWFLGAGKMQARDWHRTSHLPHGVPNQISIDMESVVCYQSIHDNKIWVRPSQEFYERFEEYV